MRPTRSPSGVQPARASRLGHRRVEKGVRGRRPGGGAARLRGRRARHFERVASRAGGRADPRSDRRDPESDHRHRHRATGGVMGAPFPIGEQPSEALMPRGAAVIRYEGARGVVWRIKFEDVDGLQVMETLGPESRGWTEAKDAGSAYGSTSSSASGGAGQYRSRSTNTPSASWASTCGSNLKRTTVEGYGRPSTAISGRSSERRRSLRSSRRYRPLHQPQAPQPRPKTITNHLLLLNVMLQSSRSVAADPAQPVGGGRPTEVASRRDGRSDRGRGSEAVGGIRGTLGGGRRG